MKPSDILFEATDEELNDAFKLEEYENIYEYVRILNEEISERTKIIKDIQDNLCKHVGHEIVPKGDTGNWCRQDDSYWYEHACDICGKRWHTDQGIAFEQGGIIKRRWG